MSAPKVAAPLATLQERIETLTRFAAFLGSFRLKGFPQTGQSLLSQCFSELLSCAQSCSVPSLSLTSLTPNKQHDQCHQQQQQQQQQHNHHHHKLSSKHEIEARAASHLSQPICFQREPGHKREFFNRAACARHNHDRDHDGDGDGAHPMQHVGAIPPALLSNLESSFLLLFQARLRAYVTLLGRHGMALLEEGSSSSGSRCHDLQGTDDRQDEQDDEEQQEGAPHCDDRGLSAVEHKLLTLLDLASQVHIENLVTTFSIATNTDASKLQNSSHCNNDGSAIVELPLTLKATIDVFVPGQVSSNNNSNNNNSVTLVVEAPGTVMGQFSDDEAILTAAKVDVDTHQLMDHLMDKATFVVSSILECITTKTTTATSSTNQDITENEASTSTNDEQEQASTNKDSSFSPSSSSCAPKRTRTVSLDLMIPDSNNSSSNNNKMGYSSTVLPPVLSLRRRTSISYLPAEACANIVDSVIPSHTFQVRPGKRARTTATA